MKDGAAVDAIDELEPEVLGTEHQRLVVGAGGRQHYLGSAAKYSLVGVLTCRLQKTFSQAIDVALWMVHHLSC